MAVMDYQGRTSIRVEDAEVKTTSDGQLEITLKDKAGNVLDTYTIDPKTGEGTNSANEAVSLPQTGNNSMSNMFIAFAAFLLIVLGSAAALLSKVLERRKESEE